MSDLRVIADPTVYLLSKQTLQQGELDRFLADHGVTWSSDSTVASEVVTETAGRTCFDDLTEILTDEGWRRFADLTRTERVMTLNPQTFGVEWQQPDAYQEYDYEGELWSAEGRDISFAVTPEHRQFGTFRYDQPRDRGRYGFTTTAEVGDRRFCLLSAAGGWRGSFPASVEIPTVTVTQSVGNQFGSNLGTATITRTAQRVRGRDQVRALAQLLVYYAAEGSPKEVRGSGQGVVIYGDHVAEVTPLCDALGLRWSVYTDKRNQVPRVMIYGGVQWKEFFASQAGRGSENKCLPRWVLELPAAELMELWNILVRTDGHVYPSGREVLVTTSPTLAGQAQEILCKIGASSAVRPMTGGTNHQCYMVSRKHGRSIHLNDRVRLERKPYRGKVYCVTTGNGVVYVRRNGVVHFSGNCYMSFARPRPGGNAAYLGHIKEVGHGSVFEHAVWTFLLTGLSRSLTHELVRHRAGWAYCLAGDTLIYSDHFCNGKREGTKKRRIDDLFKKTQTHHGRSRLKLLRLRCLDEASGTFTQGRVKAVAHSGVKPVFRVELEGGKSITCSRDHRFLTPDGWQPLHQIVGGLDVSAGGLAVHGPLATPVATNGVAAYKDADWLRRQYVELGLEQQQIADLAGVSAHTIRSWVRKHRLQKPMGSWTIDREPWNKGKKYTAGWKHTPETRQRLGEQKRGARNPHWKGGVTPYSVTVRRGVSELAPGVMARFDYTCQLCLKRGGKLVMHHVLPIWARPDLALESSNLVPLCEPCHQQRVNGHELEFSERFGAGPAEVADARTRRRNKGGGRTLVPRFRKVVSVSYVGVQDTYDIEMDGPNANFVANGIVTHNSQLSQRYVDESVAEYVEPDIIAGDPEMHAVWLDAVSHAHAAYVKLAELLNTKLADPAAAAAAMLPPDADRTTRRKTARQAARSVLPNATETKITVTANARALRHFLEQRGSVHAEPEIRKLANVLLDVLVKDAPNLFGDYQRTPLPDGTFEITTVFPKV